MLEELRRRVSQWVARDAPEAPAFPLLFADHEEIRDIARQMSRTKVEMDRSVLALRSWARELTRRLEDSPAPLGRTIDLRTLGETVGGLAHNFNNSLAAILAYTELLLKEVQGETAVRRLKVIRDVAVEASVSVRRFQEFVSREPQVAFGPVGLPGVVAEALEMTAPRWRDEAERSGVVIAVTQDLQAIPPVEGNGFELRDALVQLILNAVTAMPYGGTLGVRAASEESGWVVLEVSDTGVGMPEEIRRRVADRSLGGLPGGHPGRGLADVADIVERHGGSLSIESAEGKGTTVRLRLHASRFQIIPPSEALVEPVGPGQAARVLLVDDDQRLLTVLSDMMRSGGHAVTTASSGDEALAIFDPAAHDVVITDLGMPRMTGWLVAEGVKARSPETPVFLLTGWGEGVTASEASRFVDQVIAKPISADALLAQLARLRRADAASS
ncbi:MAG: response regulator [Candidatus Rokubacteria bacterium]|nr:response regulator [Candidatus Rokubacteria bacterium]